MGMPPAVRSESSTRSETTMTQPISALTRISYAIDSDERFKLRLQAACTLSGVEYTRDLGFQIALRVVDQITSTDGDDINTSQVEDSRLLEALSATRPEAKTKEVLHALEPKTKGTLEPATKEKHDE